MIPVPKDEDKEAKKAVEEFLANGGKIVKCEPGARTEEIEYKGGFYQRRKKKKEAEENNNT